MRPQIGTRANPIRQSTIKAWFVCEVQGTLVAAQEPRDGIGTPAWLGSIEHKAFELLHRAPNRVEERSAIVDEACSLVLADESTPLLPGQRAEILDAVDVVHEHVGHYIDLGWFEYHQRGLIGVEIPWRARVGRWWCRGTIDHLHEPRPGFIQLFDTKTGIPSTPHSRAIDVQLPLYNAGLLFGEIHVEPHGWIRLGRKADRTGLFETKRCEVYKRNGRRGTKTWFAGEMKSSPEAEVYVGDREIERVVALVDEMGARMNGFYTRGPHRLTPQRTGLAYGACHNCGYRRPCGVDLPGLYLTENDLIQEHGRTWPLPEGEPCPTH